ncbi:unnamed protein product [Schistocephalus solidus]|uniref:Uncharacterized protein n=1 Tax=Schistocephalus solidus TaxID=70667 RepID=A0A183TR70_SCHSO|nr:unnamed protein product [Schistocephalus solidus]
MIEENAGEDISGDIQQRDPLAVVTELAVPFLLVDVDNGCVFEILRDFSLLPHLLEERSESVHQQAIDGGVGDAGGLVENTLDLRLLSEQRPAFSTENRGGVFDGRSIDSLGGGEEVLPFVSVRSLLYLLGLEDHPGILHIPQQLL